MKSRTDDHRADVYYWKCDRPAAFQEVAHDPARQAILEEELRRSLAAHFPGGDLRLQALHSQGNHKIFVLEGSDQKAFVRVADGPEGDDHFEVEDLLLPQLRDCGIPVPNVLAYDCTRTKTDFAWQALAYVPFHDLNHEVKTHQLPPARLMRDIGAAVAQWQGLRFPGFGPFQSEAAHAQGVLRGHHEAYATYFTLRLEKHLAYLVTHEFLTEATAVAIQREIEAHAHLLSLAEGCLVHKDLALWNILGSSSGIAAFVDWDDAICGDSMDDLSLLACFHDGPCILRLFEGYECIRPLPPEYRRRFWLHLLRNMVVKAVIRIGAGFFERDEDLFLIGAGSSGAALRAFTQARLQRALEGLRHNAEVDTL